MSHGLPGGTGLRLRLFLPLSSDCLLFVSPIPSSPPSAHGTADEGSDSQTAGWSKLELWMIAFATIAGHATPPTRRPRSRLCH